MSSYALNFLCAQGCKCTCICSLLPAVILEIAQHASFLMDSLALPSRCSRHGRAELLIITCVCTSSPVTMLPTARNAADTTLCWVCLKCETLYEVKNKK